MCCKAVARTSEPQLTACGFKSCAVKHWISSFTLAVQHTVYCSGSCRLLLRMENYTSLCYLFGSLLLLSKWWCFSCPVVQCGCPLHSPLAIGLVFVPLSASNHSDHDLTSFFIKLSFTLNLAFNNIILVLYKTIELHFIKVMN